MPRAGQPTIGPRASYVINTLLLRSRRFRARPGPASLDYRLLSRASRSNKMSKLSYLCLSHLLITDVCAVDEISTGSDSDYSR